MIEDEGLVIVALVVERGDGGGGNKGKARNMHDREEGLGVESNQELRKRAVIKKTTSGATVNLPFL